MFFIPLLLGLCTLPFTQSVKLMIDGTIDLGPNWNFEYKLHPMRNLTPRKKNSENSNAPSSDNSDAPTSDNSRLDDIKIDWVNYNNNNKLRTKITAADPHKSSSEDEPKSVTKLFKSITVSGNMFESPRKIADDDTLNDFSNFIFNQTLKIFENLEEKIKNESIVNKILELEKKYGEKFGQFINETKQHYIRTKLGYRKVILNTVDYSNKVLNRLVKRFKVDMESKDSKSDVGKVFQNEVNILRTKEYNDICNKFSICRVGNEFSYFILELLETLIKTDDDRLQLATEALAQVLKNSDFSKIMDSETQKAFKHKVEILEELEPFDLRDILLAYRIVLVNKHQPFYHTNPDEPWIRSTVAMYHVINIFDDHLQKTEESHKEWEYIKTSLEEWRRLEKKDILEIAKKFVNHVINNGIGKMNRDIADDIKSKMRLFMLNKSLRSNHDENVPLNLAIGLY